MNLMRILVFLLCFAAIGFAVWRMARPSSRNTPVQAGKEALQQELAAGTDKQVIRVQVEGFGSVLKNVSLLSPNASQDIARVYKPYLSRSLWSSWSSHPETAAGREVSSPWPERIDVVDISQLSVDDYTVRAVLVMMTSEEVSSGGDAGTASIVMNVIREDGVWKIDSYDIVRQNGPNTERSFQDRPQLE
ncbi:hypothetical protein IT401_00140 [Candidatus Nomurabacteria bacterium]|nr:hypothetical protein [Candidatus Nomurabacteria bacterium]